MRGNASASLWDIGDGVALPRVPHEDERASTATSCELLAETIAMAPRALVLHNDGAQFSVGANLAGVLLLANTASWDDLDAAIRAGQETFSALRYAPFPVVGAPAGMALGGGCEVLLHCDAIQAHAETYIGLVEVGVGDRARLGRLPAPRPARCAERAPYGPLAPVQAAFETIGLASVSGSAAEARALGFLRADDGITMNRDRLLGDAAAPSRWSWPTAMRRPSGSTCACPARPAAPRSSSASPATRWPAARCRTTWSCCGELANVLAGGDADPTTPVSEQHVYDLERAAVISLLHREPDAAARRAHARRPASRCATDGAILADVRFLLHDVLGETETYDDVLAAAAELCRDVLAPLNAPGDVAGARLGRRRGDHAGGLPGGLPRGCRGRLARADGGTGVRRPGPAARRRGGVRGDDLRRQPVVLHVSRAHHGCLPGGRRCTARDEQKARCCRRSRSGTWTGTMCLTEAARRHRSRDDPHARRARRRGRLPHLRPEDLHHRRRARPDRRTSSTSCWRGCPTRRPGTRGISLFSSVPATADGRRHRATASRASRSSTRWASARPPPARWPSTGAAGWLVGEPHRGMRAMFTMMNAARLGVGIQGLALAEESYQQAAAYARDRLQGRALRRRRTARPRGRPDHRPPRRAPHAAAASARRSRAAARWRCGWRPRSTGPRPATRRQAATWWR